MLSYAGLSPLDGTVPVPPFSLEGKLFPRLSGLAPWLSVLDGLVISVPLLPGVLRSPRAVVYPSPLIDSLGAAVRVEPPLVGLGS